MIKVVVFDIDGVVTDGTIIVNENGEEQKKINLKDIDAIFELKRRGFIIAAVTGEKKPIVSYFEKRFPWDSFYLGKKDKVTTLKEIEKSYQVTSKEICYIGDGKYDVSPLEYSGIGICPADAINLAQNASDIILQKKGGEGCIWELIDILENINDKNTSQNYFYSRVEEHLNLFKKMSSDTKLISNIMEASDLIFDCISRGNQILLCGNGGSAADAQHIATEFISKFYKERPAMNAEALTVNTSTLTAVANDYSYERIFVRQLEAKAKEGDVFIGITTSGNSKNVIEALRYAKSIGMLTILMTGESELHSIDIKPDWHFCVPSSVTPRIQEGHIFVGHLMAEYIEEKL